MIPQMVSPQEPKQIRANRNRSPAIETVASDCYDALPKIDLVTAKPQSFADEGASPIQEQQQDAKSASFNLAGIPLLGRSNRAQKLTNFSSGVDVRNKCGSSDGLARRQRQRTYLLPCTPKEKEVLECIVFLKPRAF